MFHAAWGQQADLVLLTEAWAPKGDTMPAPAKSLNLPSGSVPERPLLDDRIRAMC